MSISKEDRWDGPSLSYPKSLLSQVSPTITITDTVTDNVTDTQSENVTDTLSDTVTDNDSVTYYIVIVTDIDKVTDTVTVTVTAVGSKLYTLCVTNVQCNILNIHLPSPGDNILNIFISLFFPIDHFLSPVINSYPDLSTEL